MLTAALDTAARTAAFIVVDTDAPDPIVVVEGIPTGRATSALFGSILDALAVAAIDINDIRQWTIGMGPGSFTGIRVGAALVKGVCAVSNAAYRGVPSSYAMAVAGGEDRDEVAILHDGRRDEVLVSLYARIDDEWMPKKEAYACPISELTDLGTGRFVMLSTDRAVDRVREVESGRLFVLETAPIKHLLDAPTWPSKADQESSVEPVYVRPAVFVEPRRFDAP